MPIITLRLSFFLSVWLGSESKSILCLAGGRAEGWLGGGLSALGLAAATAAGL